VLLFPSPTSPGSLSFSLRHLASVDRCSRLQEFVARALRSLYVLHAASIRSDAAWCSFLGHSCTRSPRLRPPAPPCLPLQSRTTPSQNQFCQARPEAKLFGEILFSPPLSRGPSPSASASSSEPAMRVRLHRHDSVVFQLANFVCRAPHSTPHSMCIKFQLAHSVQIQYPSTYLLVCFVQHVCIIYMRV
jgi:hypothetical protein